MNITFTIYEDHVGLIREPLKNASVITFCVHCKDECDGFTQVRKLIKKTMPKRTYNIMCTSRGYRYISSTDRVIQH